MKTVKLHKFQSNGRIRFYYVTTDENKIKTEYGLLGTQKPQGSSKELVSEIRADKEFDKIVNKQLKNGYNIVNGDAAVELESMSGPVKGQILGKSSKKSAEAIQFMNLLRKMKEIKEEPDISDPEVAELVDFVESL